MIIESKVGAWLVVTGTVAIVAGVVQAIESGDNNTVVWIAAMSSFVTLCVAGITAFVTYSGQQAATRERTAKAKEDREANAKVIETVEVGNVSIGKVEHAVNSEQSAVKAELKASREATASALVTIADLTKKYELLVANVTRPTSAPAPVSAAPFPVVITDTEKPVDVNMVEKKKP